MTTTISPRVYLSVPFAEKEEAKRNGAFWDAVLGTWWIERRDIGAFPRVYRWITDNPELAKQAKDAADFLANTRRNVEQTPARDTPSDPIPATTLLLPSCACTTPPWEHCEHTLRPQAPQRPNA